MKDATVRTILRRLEEKGYVTHRVEGRTYIYRGLERPEKAAVSAIRQLLDRFCGGSVEQLLVGMVRSGGALSSRRVYGTRAKRSRIAGRKAPENDSGLLQ